MQTSDVPPNKRKRRGRWLWRGVGVVLFLYVGSYAVLSVTGGWIVSESGELRPGIVAVADVFIWQPRYGRCELFQFADGTHRLRFNDRLGTFYAPLILLDQSLVHRTIRFMKTDFSFVTPLPAPPLGQYHPLFASRFHGRWPYEKASDSAVTESSAGVEKNK